jgi:hypothetical protein
MAYDPTNFFNNGTLVGVAGNVNAPGGQGTWVIVNGVASYYPPNSTAYIPGAGITITGTAPVLTIANAGVVDLVQGSITAAGVIDIGANLTLNAGGTLSGSAGGGGSLGVNYAGTIYPTVAAGAEISLSGTAGVLTIASQGVTAEVGTIFSSFNTLVAGSEITFSGTSPDLTISSAGGGSGGITEFVQGTVTATGAATIGTGLTLTGTTNPTLTAGTAAGTIGVEFGGTLYPTLAAGSGFTLTGSGATLTGSASGSGGGATFTNGTVSLVPSVVSISTGLGLVNDSTYPSSPTVVNSNTNSYPNSGSGSNSLFLSATPTLGNYVLIVVINAPGFGSGGTPTATSSMTLIADLEINVSGAYVSVYGGTVISGDPNPGLSNLGASSGIIYEFTGSTVSGVTAALVSVASSGSYVLSYTQSSLINSVVLSAFEIANLPTLSSPLPSGSTVDANIYNNQTVNLQVLRSPVVTGAATFGVTSSAPNASAPNGVSIIVKGVQTASLSEVILTAQIPTTINGTFAGDFETMTITTGNTATSVSISGTSLILNLGTP